MKIGQNSVVELCYELEVDGEIVDRTTREKPLDYIQGTGPSCLNSNQMSKGLNRAASSPSPLPLKKGMEKWILTES